MHHQVAHDLVVDGGVVAHTEVDHHSEYFVWMEGLLGDFQIEGITDASNHW